MELLTYNHLEELQGYTLLHYLSGRERLLYPFSFRFYFHTLHLAWHGVFLFIFLRFSIFYYVFGLRRYFHYVSIDVRCVRSDGQWSCWMLQKI